jgi:selenocysteine lyase/cysteine desulfurase
MNITFETLQNQIIGNNYKFKTPYGERVLTYADFTASGKTLGFIEKYLLEVQKCYGNTHTEDDITGEVMTKILHKSADIIKKYLNADENCYVIPSGSGATGAIESFAKIIGIYIPPASKKRIKNIIDEYKKSNKGINKMMKNSEKCLSHLPVVFIGPYEHHSNILIWKEGMAEVVEIGLNNDGALNLEELKRKVSDEKYVGRLKIGSFSAASNVTGILTPVFKVAEILHENNAYACFDFAACAPYINIDMNKSDTEYFDAVYIAPHKFIGGPGSSGILVINKKMYDGSIPPTVAGGGTVSFVSPYAYDFINSVEDREMAGTPGIIQILRSALVIELKNYIGLESIEQKERYYTQKVLERLSENKNIEILGPKDVNNRLPIFSIKFKHDGKYIHPRFATKLINDLFGVQTRAGCACAAPYGHRLLDISSENSSIYRYFIKDGMASIKPGWLRFNIHYVMTECQVDFICNAMEFVADYGYLFLSDYIMDLKSGKWKHKSDKEEYATVDRFGIEESLEFIDKIENEEAVCKINLNDEYERYLAEAENNAKRLKENSVVELKSFKEEGIGWFYFMNTE